MILRHLGWSKISYTTGFFTDSRADFACDRWASHVVVGREGQAMTRMLVSVTLGKGRLLAEVCAEDTGKRCVVITRL